MKEGRHVIMIKYGGYEIPHSPFEVNVGPKKDSKIRAYGPGLSKGAVGFPALFTVETLEETGTLGNFLKPFYKQIKNCFQVSLLKAHHRRKSTALTIIMGQQM